MVEVVELGVAPVLSTHGTKFIIMVEFGALYGTHVLFDI